MYRSALAQFNGKLRWAVNMLLKRHLVDRPVFHDIDEVFKALRKIDQSFAVVREEVLAVLPEKHRIPRYHEVDGTQEFLAGDGDWRMLYVHMHGSGDRIPTRRLCPRTAALVDEIPDVCGAYLSILDAGKSIAPHSAPYLGNLRYHLGLVVPEDNPPSIRIRDEYYTWRKGESVLFDDTLEHEVFNEADSIRVVLIVDVMRPLPWWLDKLNRLVVWVSSAKMFREEAWVAMKLRGEK